MPVLMDVKPGSPEWLAARRAGVTATDIVTILGLSSHDSVYSLYWRKLGQVPDEPDRDRWQLGRHLEPYVRTRWALAQEIAIFGDKPGLYRSGDRAWQMATPDGVLYTDDAPSAVAVLELKSWADADRKSWEGGPPAAVRAQLLWQMDVLDVAAGYWAVVFLPSGRFDHGSVEHGNACCKGFIPATGCDVCVDQDLMRKAGHEFYRRLTLELPPPDPDNSAATLAALRARFTRTEGKQAEIDSTVYAAWSDARDVADFWKKKTHEYEIALRDHAGEADVLTVDGLPVAKRIVSDSAVKAHTRHMDYYLRIKQTGETDDE